MLDEMFQPNAPKFAILLEYENPYSNDIPFVRGKQTKHEMKNKQKTMQFFLCQMYSKF